MNQHGANVMLTRAEVVEMVYPGGRTPAGRPVADTAVHAWVTDGVKQRGRSGKHAAVKLRAVQTPAGRAFMLVDVLDFIDRLQVARSGAAAVKTGARLRLAGSGGVGGGERVARKPLSTLAAGRIETQANGRRYPELKTVARRGLVARAVQ